MKKQHFTWKEFDKVVSMIVTDIKYRKRKFKEVYGVPRGGLPLATSIAYRLELPITSKVGPHTLVCDDINDTGTTLKKYNEANIAVIHSKMESRVTAEFVGYMIPNGYWVVYPWETLKTSKLDRKK